MFFTYLRDTLLCKQFLKKGVMLQGPEGGIQCIEPDDSPVCVMCVCACEKCTCVHACLVCVRACVRACMRVCVRACVRMRVCVCACVCSRARTRVSVCV